MVKESPFQAARALVIDGNPTLRRATVAQLRELGIERVRQCKGLADARLVLEQTDFDFVLCADGIEGSELDGQGLLEELRRESILPHATVFVMLASEATYTRVMEAAEAALDCFLLRPYRLSDLAERLLVARRRKTELSAVFSALEQHRHDDAVQACLQRYEAQQPYAMHCARMAAEILLKVGRNDEALALFTRVAQAHDASWARLGMARAHFAAGDTTAARRLVEALLRTHPDMVEAWDVLGRVQLEQGELQQALRSWHTVSEITPGCNLRLQHCGTLAFYLGDRELAVEALERAVALGLQSRLFDALTLMLLAFLRHDAGDARKLALAHAQLQHYQRSYPQSRRLQRFDLAASALRALLSRQLDQAQSLTLTLAGERHGEDFDLEASNVVLALWTRLPTRDVGAGQQDRLVREVAMRFCMSKAVTEVLVAAARHHESMAKTLRLGQAEVTALAEQALKLALAGDPRSAVQMLLQQGEATRNARLIEMSGLLLQRHRERIADGAELQAQASHLHAMYCRPITHVAGIRRSGRSPGGLLLRGARLGPATDHTPTVRADALPRDHGGTTGEASPAEAATAAAPGH